MASFDWTDVDHDVFKALYQSVIAPDVRKRFGEYYTPDWLADRIVVEAINDPAHDRVLDPACGSGTFLFHAVRRHLEAAEAAGATAAETLTTVTNSVFGMDLHPVAVTLAQTTYLFAIGRDRLLQRTDTVNIPVYLGDSMRWEAAAENVFTSAGDVVLHTAGEAQGQLFGSEIRFPASVVADVGRFDHLVNELAAKASSRQPGAPRPNVSGLLSRLGVAEDDRPVVEATTTSSATFTTTAGIMCGASTSAIKRGRHGSRARRTGLTRSSATRLGWPTDTCQAPSKRSTVGAPAKRISGSEALVVARLSKISRHTSSRERLICISALAHLWIRYAARRAVSPDLCWLPRR